MDSITSSAMESTPAGMEKPNALAAPGATLGLPGVDTEDDKTPH